MGTLAISIELPPSGELETSGDGTSPTLAQMDEELRGRQKFIDTVSPYLASLPDRSPHRIGNVSRVELLGRSAWSQLNHYLLLITVDSANPGIDQELSPLLPEGSRVSVAGFFDRLSDGPAIPAVEPVRAAPATVNASPVTAAAATHQQGLSAAAVKTELGSVRTWTLSTAERALSTFAASLVSALTLSGPFGIPAVGAALFAGASAALCVVAAAIRSLSPPTDNKAMDVVTRVGLTMLQAFAAAFVTSTAGATHFSDWRAGALAGVAAAFTALKCTWAVRLNGASATNGERPTPASMMPLRAGAAPDARVASREALA